MNPPLHDEYLALINYRSPTSADLGLLAKTHGLKASAPENDRSSHWEIVVDSAILTDLSHALYGDKKWAETKLYTEATPDKNGECRRKGAIYLDFNEQIILNSLASHLVSYAHGVANVQPPESPTENLCEIFDLALNFIMYVALKLREAVDPLKLTSKEFASFLDHHPAYKKGKGLIFQPESPKAREFLLGVYKYATTCKMQKPFFGGHSLHFYMPPRRIFGKMREHTLHDELLKDLGLSALIKEANPGMLSGPLDELSANYIHSGPFRLVMSERIQDHLTFRVDGSIVLYDFKKFDFIVLWRNCIVEYTVS